MSEGAKLRSHGEGEGADEVGILTEFPPGKAITEARIPRTAGGPRLPEGPEKASLPGYSLGWLGCEVRAPHQGGACYTPVVEQGSQELLHGKHVCSGYGEQHNLPPAPSAERPGRSLRQRLGAQSRERRVAHRTPAPPPTSQTRTSPGEGLRLDQGRWESWTSRPTPHRVTPRALARPSYHAGAAPHPSSAAVPSRADLIPPSRAPVQPRLRAGPERPAADAAKTRAGGRRSRIGEGGTSSVALACLPPRRRRRNPA